MDFLEKSIYGIEEVARDIRTYGDKLEHDPGRLEEIESRLELIRNLKRKYGKNIGEILDYLNKSEKELDGLVLSSERKSQLKSEYDQLKEELGKLAEELSKARSQAASKLTADVKKELQDLEMSQMQFAVSVTQTQSPEGLRGADGALYAFSGSGIDNVEFIVSTNPGEPLKPLARIASTGEISRFTLALKGALSEADHIPVLIFDEIDIGVGGRSGDIIGKKLWALARNHQVICVTHLPQIAAYADAHFGVHKEVAGERTTSTLEKLAGSSQVQELAIMLAGPGYTETALKNARELLQKARDWKEVPDKERKNKAQNKKGPRS
jgi:DNA repair protein RecN (Recombination protein N)